MNDEKIDKMIDLLEACVVSLQNIEVMLSYAVTQDMPDMDDGERDQTQEL
jgi:hypothetical protein